MKKYTLIVLLFITAIFVLPAFVSCADEPAAADALTTAAITEETTADYRDINASEQLAVLNKLYFMPGDISMGNLAGARFLYFNKKPGYI